MTNIFRILQSRRSAALGERRLPAPKHTRNADFTARAHCRFSHGPAGRACVFASRAFIVGDTKECPGRECLCGAEICILSVRAFACVIAISFCNDNPRRTSAVGREAYAGSLEKGACRVQNTNQGTGDCQWKRDQSEIPVLVPNQCFDHVSLMLRRISRGSISCVKKARWTSRSIQVRTIKSRVT